MSDWTQPRRMLEFFAACGVTSFNLGVRIATADGEREMRAASNRTRSRGEIERSLGWAWHENAHAAADVYIRPDRAGTWAVVFLDDVTPAKARAIAGKYRALVIETSPGRCHVWLATTRALDTEKRAAVQKRLAPLCGADPASTSGEHFGRLAGFKNWKHGGCWVNVIAEGAGSAYTPAPFPSQAGPEIGGACASHPHATAADADESGRDFGFAVGRLRWAQDAGRLATERENVAAQLAGRALARGKRRTEAAARAYAEHTVARAIAIL